MIDTYRWGITHIIVLVWGVPYGENVLDVKYLQNYWKTSLQYNTIYIKKYVLKCKWTARNETLKIYE